MHVRAVGLGSGLPPPICRLPVCTIKAGDSVFFAIAALADLTFDALLSHTASSLLQGMWSLAASIVQHHPVTVYTSIPRYLGDRFLGQLWIPETTDKKEGRLSRGFSPAPPPSKKVF